MPDSDYRVVESNNCITWYKDINGKEVLFSMWCYNSNGELNSKYDLPAMIFAINNKYWYKDGIRHRDGNLPACECEDGKFWYKDGRRHRDDGLPACEWVDGTREWYKNGKHYRDDGLPAIEWANGSKWWYKNGKITKKQ